MFRTKFSVLKENDKFYYLGSKHPLFSYADNSDAFLSGDYGAVGGIGTVKIGRIFSLSLTGLGGVKVIFSTIRVSDDGSFTSYPLSR